MSEREQLELAMKGLLLSLQYIKNYPPALNAQGEGNIFDEQYKLSLKIRKICKDLGASIKNGST